MTRLERIQTAIERGYTYEPSNGKIFNRYGKEIKGKHTKGYIQMGLKIDGHRYILKGHQLAWYVIHKEVVEQLDHINGNRSDNRIENLRSVTNQENAFNRIKAKGYTWDKNANKYKSQIGVDGKSINLGYYDTEEEAHRAYLDAKKIYHKIS